MQKILITGGAGFIGSSLTRLLIERGNEVTILDNLLPQIHGDDPPITSPLYRSLPIGSLRFIQGTVTDRGDWTKALDGQDVVVHLAAETGTGQSMYEISRYSEVNITGTALLLDILANQPHRVKKVVIASSRAIYGEGRYFSPDLGRFVYPNHRLAADMDCGDFEVKYPGSREPLQLVATDEESMIHPSSVYGITKQNQEQLIMTVCPAIGIAPVAFRYQNVYGPGQSLRNPYTGIISIFSNLIRNGHPINIFEDGRESRDFVFIDDIVEATYLGIVKSSADGKVFNVGTGVPTDVMNVALTLMKHLKLTVELQVSGNYRVGDIRHNFADLSRIKTELGFHPSVSFDEGMARFINWVESQPTVQDAYESSLREMKNKGLFK